MAGTTAEMLAELRSQVEEMASYLLVEGPVEGEWLNILRRISERARASSSELALTAMELEVQLRRSELPEVRESILTAGIERLRSAIELEAQQPPGDSAFAQLASDPDLVRDFVMEAREHLDRSDVQLLNLEKDPANADAINEVFRSFHTIKGLAGFLELNEIRTVAHEAENLLDLVRQNKLRFSPAIADIVLGATDFLRHWLVRVETLLGGQPAGTPPDSTPLLDNIRRVIETGGAEAAAVLHGSPAEQTMLGEDRSDNRSVALAETRAVRVDTEKLDHMADMVGELLIAESMVRHYPEIATLQNPALLRDLSQLARITAELQRTAMSMRMVPIQGLFQKMSRLVRDLSRKSGKVVEMESAGGDTELDRNIVEQLADPLMHMIRNSVDHGIEEPEARLAAGKPAVGKVTLSAAHQAGYIVISIVDDGKGLDKAKILAKARQQGVIEDSAVPSDNDIYHLIFHPGLSTAAKITDISGRGVGMDVVKKQIQKLRGRIEISTEAGVGTTFQLKLPLTLAIIDGLVVGVGEERYIVPLFSVREMLRPGEEMLFTIEGRHEMAMVRGSLLPVVRLAAKLGVEAKAQRAEDSLLLVAEARGATFCVMVDELIGKQEVVIKGLGEMLKSTPGIAGGAILGNGQVGLILDLDAICGQ
jgi:two-component system chemotaxis sensor kinase CheA